MKSFIVYDADGKILRTGHCQEEDFLLQAEAYEFIIEGEADFLTQYIVDGAVVGLPKKPVGEYKFNYKSHEWEFDDSTAIRNALARRNQLLSTGPDRISPMWWNTMSPELQQAWSDYRQALLDITAQPGYPQDIIWPVKP